MRTLLFSLAFFVAAYLVVCLTVFLAQKRLVFFPERGLIASPADAGLTYEDVFLTTEDGLRIHAWYVPAAAPQASRIIGRGDASAKARSGAVLFCHGNAGNLSHRLDTLRFLHELGLAVLAFDYRGYGRSEGKPDEAGTYADAMAAWRQLSEERGFPPERIVIFGRSIGAAVAIELASRVQPGALVVGSAFSSAPDLGARIYPWLPVRLIMRIRYDNAARVGAIECPKLFVQARGDEIVPFAMGRRLFERAAEPKTFLEIRGGHNDAWLISRERYTVAWERLLDEAGF